MPELPEVERVRQTLAHGVVGRKIRRVELRRSDVVKGPTRPRDLLAGATLASVQRTGKQLALVAEDGRCLCVHLGMTGSLQWQAPRHPLAKTEPTRATRSARGTANDPHLHLLWRFEGNGTLQFRDPRRFGGVWTFPSLEALHMQRWSRLGEDALAMSPGRLHRRLVTTTRAIKAALLDQAVIAGLGNIYVDELLFAAGIHPSRPANTLALNEVRGLVRRMRTLLGQAIALGGSTVRDYADAAGNRGNFQQRHRVYGRADLPCRRCHKPLTGAVLHGRTTVFCTCCQCG